MLKETDLIDQIADILIAKGWVVVRINSGSFTFSENIKKRYLRAYIIKNINLSSGFPDLMAFRYNHNMNSTELILIEVKKPECTKSLTKSQKFFHEFCKIQNIPIYILSSWEEALLLANTLDKR
jgi:hypothetical protein